MKCPNCSSENMNALSEAVSICRDCGYVFEPHAYSVPAQNSNLETGSTFIAFALISILLFIFGALVTAALTDYGFLASFALALMPTIAYWMAYAMGKLWGDSQK